MSCRANRQRGFTLLEVLVAFTLLTTVLGVLLNLNSLALESTARSADRQLALMLAQSQLERVLARPELHPGREMGRFSDERFQWQLNVTRFEFPDAEPDWDEALGEPYEIELSVHWDGGRELSLSTLRLVKRL